MAESGRSAGGVRAAGVVGRLFVGIALMGTGFLIGVAYAFADLPEPTSTSVDPSVQSVLRTTTQIQTELAELRRQVASLQSGKRR